MASFNPPKKNAAFVMYVGLRSQADVRLMQVNPTLAAGDVKVSKDGGTLANVTTLPTVISSSAVVKLELSSTEMNADNVTVVFIDAAGGQWCDLIVNLQTAARQFDELASQTSVDTVDDYLDTEIAAIKAKTDNLPSSPAAVGSAMTLATDAVSADALKADAVAEIQSGLATAAALQTVDDLVDDLETRLTATRAGYLDNLSGGATATAAALGTVAGYVDTEVAAIKAKTDLIPASPAAVGSAMTLAANAVSAAALAADAVAEIQAGLSTLTAGQVNAEVVDALSVDTYAEPGGVPGATSSLKDKIGWLFMLARNKRTTTATGDKVRNDGDSADVGSSVLSDDGTTFTRGKYS